MVQAAETRDLPWPICRLLVQFIAELYRADPTTRATELKYLIQLSAAKKPHIAHLAYNELPNEDRPEIYQAHVLRFRGTSYYHRLHALNQLVELGRDRCVDILVEALDDPFEPIARVALTHLANSHPQLVEARAHQIVLNGNGSVRLDAVRVFANLPLERSLAPLFVQTFDRNVRVREAAQRSLQLLKDLNDPVVNACAYSYWNPDIFSTVLPVFVEQTAAHELEHLEQLMGAIRKNAKRSVRRALARALHSEHMRQRGKLLRVMQLRAND